MGNIVALIIYWSLCMKIRHVLIAAVALFNLGLAHAGDCAVDYTRTACAGKEAESFAKCDGKKNCVKTSPADTAQACQDVALKACANDRLDVTQSKEIKASFNGQALKSASGKDDFCADYARNK
jgi:hypothetical protein